MKILFVSHDATRTGAPIVLLHLIRWIHTQKKAEIEMLFLKGGELLPEFEKLGKIVVMRQESLMSRVLRKVRNTPRSPSRRIRSSMKQFHTHNHDVIYANTIVCAGPALQIANCFKSSPKVIGHIHELKLVISQFCPTFHRFANKLDHYIVASEIVGRNLSIYEVPQSKIDVVYEFSVNSKKKTDRSFTQEKLVIGGSGTVHWRKGHDTFIQVAKYVQNHLPNLKVEFVWVGRMAPLDQRIIEEDIRKANLTQSVRFVGETADPGQYFKQFDIFLMTSREDPFPLVCIEVGQAGVPIICFEGATGTEEVLKEGGGQVVPYLDIVAMANGIRRYSEDRQLLDTHSNQAYEIFSGFRPEKICPQLFEVIEKVIQPRA